jgi:hypothetical protein
MALLQEDKNINMSDIDIKSVDTVIGNSDDNESSTSSTPRRTTRKRKFTIIQNVDAFSKTKRAQKEKIIVPPSPEDIRTAHVETITNVFRKYISETLESVGLTPDREKTRVTGLIKSLENSRSLKKKVYVNSNMEYLVSSSAGTETYTVKPKAILDTSKNVCNCGEKYNDPDRDSCKHCGAILFYNLDNYFNEYLNKKTNPNTHLQVYRVEKMLNKCDIEKPNKKENNDSLMDKNERENPFGIIKHSCTLFDTPMDKPINKTPDTNVDFLARIMTE